MDFKDGTNPQKTPKNLTFSVEKPQPGLSIQIDDADTGYLYMEYGSMVLNRCRAILRNEENARDAAQNVFTKILENKAKDKFKPDNLQKYISGMARNMSINEINKIKTNKQKERKSVFEIYDMATNGSLQWLKDNRGQGQVVWDIDLIDKSYDQNEKKKIVNAILDEQDETTFKIYYYKFQDSLTLEQIGKLVGLKKSAVQKRIKKLEQEVKIKIEKADK